MTSAAMLFTKRQNDRQNEITAPIAEHQPWRR